MVWVFYRSFCTGSSETRPAILLRHPSQVRIDIHPYSSIFILILFQPPTTSATSAQGSTGGWFESAFGQIKLQDGRLLRGWDGDELMNQAVLNCGKLRNLRWRPYFIFGAFGHVSGWWCQARAENQEDLQAGSATVKVLYTHHSRGLVQMSKSRIRGHFKS